MDIVIKSLPDLSATEFRTCSKLTFGKIDGYMFDTMREFKDDPDAKAIMLKQGRTMIGWALLTPSKKMNYWYYGVTDHGKRHTRYTVQLFVRERQRQKGYGTLLMRECIKFDPRPFVYPHNEAAGELYSKFNIRAENRYRKENLKRKEKVSV